MLLEYDQHVLLLAETGDGVACIPREVVVAHREVGRIHRKLRVSRPEVSVWLRRASTHHHAEIPVSAVNRCIRAVHDAVVGIRIFLPIADFHRVVLRRVRYRRRRPERDRTRLSIYRVRRLGLQYTRHRNGTHLVDRLHREMILGHARSGVKAYLLVCGQSVLRLIQVARPGLRVRI